MKKKKIVYLFFLTYLQYGSAEPVTALTTVYKKTDVMVDSFVKLSSALDFRAAKAKTGVQCAAACNLSPPCNSIIFENGVCTLGTAICWGPPGSGTMSVYTKGCLNRLVLVKGGGFNGQPEGGHLFRAEYNKANEGEAGWKEFVSYLWPSLKILVVNGRWTIRWPGEGHDNKLVSFPQYHDVYNNTASDMSASFYDVCPQANVRAQEYTRINQIGNVNTWQACGVLCANDSLCVYWTWNKDGTCYTLSGMWAVVQDLNFISGSKDCTG